MKFTEGHLEIGDMKLAKNDMVLRDLDGGPWQVINDDGHEVIVKGCYRRCIFYSKFFLDPQNTMS